MSSFPSFRCFIKKSLHCRRHQSQIYLLNQFNLCSKIFTCSINKTSKTLKQVIQRSWCVFLVLNVLLRPIQCRRRCSEALRGSQVNI